MKKLVIKWLIFALIIMATCYLPGIAIENFWFAMLLAVVLTVINIFIKPIVKLLTLPLNLLTFGLFNLFINWGFLYIAAYFVPQYRLENPVGALFASMIIAISYVILKNV